MEGKIQFSKEGIRLFSEVETFSGRKMHEEFYHWDDFSWDIIKGYQNVSGSYSKNDKGELHLIELQLKSCSDSNSLTINNLPREQGNNSIKGSSQPKYIDQFRRERQIPGTQANEIMNFIKEKKKVKMYEIIAHVLSKGYKKSGSLNASVRSLVVDDLVRITGRGDSAILEWVDGIQ